MASSRGFHPASPRVVRFFDDNEVCLARVLDEGRDAGTLRFTGSAREIARTIVSGLEGAMLVARALRGYRAVPDDRRPADRPAGGGDDDRAGGLGLAPGDGGQDRDGVTFIHLGL